MEQKKKILIKRGTVVSVQSVSQMDLLIEGELVSGLGDFADLKTDVEIDAQGLLV